jgi:two-component system sensor histidine kinase ChiS
MVLLTLSAYIIPMKKQLLALLLLLLCLGHSPSFAQKQAIKDLLEQTKGYVNRHVTDSAIILADKALLLAKQGNDSLLQAKAMTLKGKSLFYQDKSTEAIALFFDALRLCKSPKDDKQIAYIYGEIGYVYYSKGHPEQAKDYYEKELAIRRVVNGKDSVGNQLINLSAVYQGMGRNDSALRKMNELAGILTRNHNKPLSGYYYLNLGALMQLTGKIDSASYYYAKAYEVWKELNNDAELYKVTFNLGFLAYQKKDYKAALNYYHLSEDAAKKYGSGRELAHVYGTMAESYAEAGNYKDAYNYLYQYAILNDSFAKEDFNSYSVKLDKQFESEKSKQTIKDQELKLQSARNQTLLTILILVAVLFAAAAFFAYATFRGRVRKQVEEAKNQFFANVVHEIRTPLSMIQGPIKVLQQRVTDEADQHQLAIAERNTTRLNDLITQMLDLSKTDARKYALAERVGSLEAFFAEKTQQYLLMAAEKKVALSIQTDIAEGNALYDADVLEKIIDNLVGNAIKYTPVDGTVGIDATMQSDSTLRLKVWDSGAGIPVDEQQRIFDRFYRRKEDEAAGIRGIGIGLALVKELVALMHGTIEVTSAPEKGSVFSVTLPIKRALPAQAVTTTGDAATVLLVEDDADIRNFNTKLLGEKGYTVWSAKDGVEATTLLKQQLPDLVITDLMMPGKDGITLLKDIRSNETTAHLPVIILSARASADAKLEGVKEGAQVFLSKPFQPEELVALVNNQLQLLAKQRARYTARVEESNKSVEERFGGIDPFTQRCFSLIQENLDDAQLSVEKLADLMNINRSHFQRKIKTLTGFSPSELIRTIRLERGKEMLDRKEGNIKEIAYMTGFTSQSYFSKCFADHFGYPPSQVAAPRSEVAATQIQ